MLSLPNQQLLLGLDRELHLRDLGLPRPFNGEALHSGLVYLLEDFVDDIVVFLDGVH